MAGYNRVPLIVPDTLLDPRFADSPAVIGPLRVRFYAGYPQIVSDGSCIGTLCIADVKPRELEPSALDELRSLADIAVREVERSRTNTSEQALVN
jgi:GAF domain-containing protein